MSMHQIPQWVIEYNNAGHQSGAGRAVKTVMQVLENKDQEIKTLISIIEDLLPEVEHYLGILASRDNKHYGEEYDKVEALIERAKNSVNK